MGEELGSSPLAVAPEINAGVMMANMLDKS